MKITEKHLDDIKGKMTSVLIKELRLEVIKEVDSTTKMLENIYTMEYVNENKGKVGINLWTI